MYYLSQKTGWTIQTRDSPEGEYRQQIANGQSLRLDGFVRRQPHGRNVAIEFLGL